MKICENVDNVICTAVVRDIIWKSPTGLFLLDRDPPSEPPNYSLPKQVERSMQLLIRVTFQILHGEDEGSLRFRYETEETGNMV